MGRRERNEEKKPFFKKAWFWIVFVILIIAAGSSASPKNNNSDEASSNKYKKDTKVEVSIIDFSTITRDEVSVWFDNNKINGTIKDEYSDTVEKGNFVSQSISAGTVAHEGDTLSVVYSLGKAPTVEQKNALKTAESYSNNMHMSKKGIYNQLTSEYGEKFSSEDAQYAIDNMKADWNANALATAKSYQTNMSMSKQRIYDQLISEYGEKFTPEEAQYAIDHLE